MFKPPASHFKLTPTILPCSIHHPLSRIQHLPFLIHYSPFTIHHLPIITHPFTNHHSPIHQPSLTHSPNITHPFTKHHSPIQTSSLTHSNLINFQSCFHQFTICITWVIHFLPFKLHHNHSKSMTSKSSHLIHQTTIFQHVNRQTTRGKRKKKQKNRKGTKKLNLKHTIRFSPLSFLVF